jgi:hypothetical protein
VTKVDELFFAIRQLSPEERVQLEDRLYEADFGAWDEQIKRDYDAGKLDDLLARVDREIDEGKVKDCP